MWLTTSNSLLLGLFSATSNTGRVSQTSISPASGSCTFTSQGPNTRGYVQYSDSQQSLSDCQGSCLHDDLCNGFTHRGSDDTCFLHESPEHQTISCATCTFVSKSCVPLTSECYSFSFLNIDFYENTTYLRILLRFGRIFSTTIFSLRCSFSFIAHYCTI